MFSSAAGVVAKGAQGITLRLYLMVTEVVDLRSPDRSRHPPDLDYYMLLPENKSACVEPNLGTHRSINQLQGLYCLT